MFVYLDSSAILKRVLTEDHSVPFREWLSEMADSAELITSTLSWVEVTRALRRHEISRGEADLDGKDGEALSGISACPISYEIVSLARRIGSGELRSLEAIHCATAVILDADLLVSYDDRLLDAARRSYVAVERPGLKAKK